MRRRICNFGSRCTMRTLTTGTRWNFKDGKQDGPWTHWYENGQKWWEVNYKDGEKDGLWTKWYENGQMKDEITWKDGKLVTAVAWKRNGEKCPHSNVVEGNGIWVSYKKVN